MDLDTAYIAPFINDWLEHLKQNRKEQEQSIMGETNSNMPFIAIPEPTVSAAFTIADLLKVEPSVKYMAIQVYDEFMCKYFWEVYKTEITNGPSEESWNKVCKKICSQSKLHLLSCFQLACKMDAHSYVLGISQVLKLLHILDKRSEYTRSMIISSELNVFKTIGFKMPFCTPLHCIEILLTKTDLRKTPKTYEISLMLLDLAYLQHETLYSRLQRETQKYSVTTEGTRRRLMLLKSNLLFLGAAIVVCTTFMLSSKINESKTIAEKVAKLSDTNATDIWKMANILLLMAVQEP